MNKMKYIINKVMLGVFTLLTTTGIVSCTDINDWETDSQYDRLFSPSSFSVSANATTAEVSWKSTAGTNYYIIEINTDSLYGKTEEYRENSIVYGVNKDITKSPCTLENLDSNTKYYIRIMGCSDAKGNSHWNYLEKFSFQTKSENILNAVDASAKGEDYITLSWSAGAAVTRVDYAEVLGTDENSNLILGDVNSVQLTEENKTDGNVTVTGLKASTSYQFTIYNNNNPRGSRVVATTLQAPEGNLKVQINAGSTLTQEMLNSWANEGSVTIIFEAGAEFTLSGFDESAGEIAGLTVPNNLSVTFFGKDGDKKATLKMAREVLMGGIHSYIRFENLIINDGGAQYLFNQGTEATASEISFKDCEFNDFSRAIVRFKDQKSISVDLLSFDNSIITNQGSGNYACVTLDAKEYTVSKIDFTNTTFNTIQHNLIALNNSSRGCATVNTVDFNNCTFYNSIGDGRYILDAGNTSQGPAVTFNNTILGKSNKAVLKDGVWTSSSKGVRTSAVNVNNTYMTVDGVFGSNTVKGCIDYTGTSDDLFKDPTNGDFTIKDGSFPTGIGAQRWYMAEE